MSFVSILCHESWVSVVTDGRVCAGDVAVDESYKKFIEPKENLFIAFAGNKEPCEVVCKGMIELGYVDLPLLDAAKKLYSLVHLMREKGFKLFMAIGGLENSKASVYSVSTEYSEPVINKPLDDQISYVFLSNTKVSDERLEKRFSKLVRRTGLSDMNSINQVQKELNKWVALQDNSVNNKYFELFLNSTSNS